MTQQIRDILIYNGHEYGLNEEILERYFELFPERQPRQDGSFTALWRGYIATFKISEKDELVMHGLEVLAGSGLNMKSVLAEVFPDGLICDWFSGLIRIDEGRGRFDEEIPGNIFEFIEIRQGNYIRLWIMNYDELQTFKEIQFLYFKETAYYTARYQLWQGNNPGMKPETIDGYILDNILRHLWEVC